MRTIEIPYGRMTCPVSIDERKLSGVLVPAGGHGHSMAPEQMVLEALRHPIGSPPLYELARDKQRVLVLTSDHTRPMPSRMTLPLLLKEIRTGSPACEVRILVATGMHRAMTQAELEERFGSTLLSEENIIMHDSTAEAEMQCYGQLPSGGELWLNALVSWAELTISEGFIEPHFFAGYSGGRKSILPGIASRKTVLFNHNAVFIADAQATQGSLDRNPIHQDMRFAARVANLSFILNVLLDEKKQIAAAFAGEPEEAHFTGCAACGASARVACVPADIIITSNGGYPLDQNLYQSVKCMTAAEKCVRQDSVIVMLAELSDGHGGEAFFHWLADREGPEQVLRDIQNIPPAETQPDQWQAQILARVLCKAQCIVVTDACNRSFIEAMHMQWAGTPEQALETAFALAGEHANVTVIPNGVEVIVQDGGEKAI